MPRGTNALYRIVEDVEVKGRLVSAGDYRGFRNLHLARRLPGGAQTRHWLSLQGDVLEITALVEQGKALIVL